jgi:hypothetical protein
MESDGARALVWLAVIAVAVLIVYVSTKSSGQVRRGPGAGATGAVYDLLNEDKRKAVEIIVEERAAAHDPEDKDELLFGYFEYHGSDLAGDFARMNADPIVKEWYRLTEPCQVPLPTRKEGEWWAQMEEVFHLD